MTTMWFSSFFLAAAAAYSQTGDSPYLNPDLGAEKRAADLVSRMTLEEKVLQMQNSAPAIPRLNIPAYDWWNEALHGVARAGEATVFPQAIGLAATWDTDLMRRVADTISTEARAKYNEALRNNDHSRYHGLTFWSPNINIFRDPRWGRGQETYGEDPYLTGRLAVAFIKGMQGDDPHYFKVIATAKHFAVHSGPESTRHQVDVKPSERDLEETYLPAFRAAIVEGKADSVMCAYNSVDGAAGLREYRSVAEAAARRVGLSRLRGERLRRDRRYFPRPQVSTHGGGGFGGGGEGRNGSDLRQRIPGVGGRGEGGTDYGSGNRPVTGAVVRRAVQAGDVRSAGARAVLEDSLFGKRFGGASQDRAGSGAEIDRAAEE